MDTINPNVSIIPALKKAANRKRVGIYARVSTARVAQLRSISAQVSGLVRHAATREDWILMDVYMDIGSAKTGASRPEFNRMLEDCKNHKLDIVVTKSMSRLGRDDLESGEAVRTIRKAGAEIYFQSEETFVERADSELELMIRAAISQSENEHRSENIRMGLKFGAMNGTSGLYRKPCYGYRKNEDGNLVPDRYQSVIVQVIFDSYLKGKTIREIVEYLDENKVPTPRGGKKWSKGQIVAILRNEKYIGEVAILKSDPSREGYRMVGAHEAIIIREEFDRVQEELAKRAKRKRVAAEYEDQYTL